MPRLAGLLTAALVLGLGTAGCARIRDLKGYVVDTELVSAIKPSIDNKASVQKTLGRPTMVSEFDGKTWYYVSRSTAQLAFMHPKPTEQQIVIVRFDDKNNVTKVEKLGKEQIANIDPSSDKTPTRGKEVSVLEQIMGNVGKFSPGVGGGGPQ